MTSPQIGLELFNPHAGTRTVFTATAASSDGHHVQVDATYPPHSAKPPVHHHPRQEEHFAVVTGAMTVIRGEESFVAVAGEEFAVPAGVPHQMWNDTDEPAVMRWTTTPALRTDEMFCALWQVAHDNEWEPSLDQLWSVLQQYGEEWCLG